MAQALLSVGHERADHDGSSGGEGHAPKEGALDRVLESRGASVDITGEGEEAGDCTQCRPFGTITREAHRLQRRRWAVVQGGAAAALKSAGNRMN